MLLRVITFCFPFLLIACTGHELPESELIDNGDTELPVEPISCNATYPVTLKSVSSETIPSTLGVDKVIDGIKTNNSVWHSGDVLHTLIFELERPALIKEFVISWGTQSVSHYFEIDLSTDKQEWINVIDAGKSKKNYIIADRVQLGTRSETAKYIKLTLNGSELNNQNSINEFEAFGCTKDASHSIELIDWYLSVQTDEDGNGKSDSIKENDLANGYYDPRFFYISEDNGLTFSSTVEGYRTSANTKYVRSELREMLRRGNSSHSTQGVNKNNWVFSSTSQSAKDKAGGVDGTLDVEVAVNHVTSTGEDYQIGRVIIGQIHANDDEPIRVYYRKLPGNTNGSIYIAHEVLGGDDIYFEVLGSRSNDANNPVDGIALGERFAYQIKVNGHKLTFTLTKNSGDTYIEIVDMSRSGYENSSQYMYFKAGVYNQNNSGDIHDFVQATFYQITNSHTGYDH